MLLKYELQNIIFGTGTVTKGDTIQSICHYLTEGKIAGTNAKEKEFIKKQETTQLVAFAESNNFFYTGIDHSRYLTEGAEQKVYLDKDNLHVIKTNESIFYLTWLDYFHSLLLHNYFFPSTAYNLIGVLLEKECLHAVVKQPYIKSTEPTNTDIIKEFMKINGFRNTRNNDYRNAEAGIILEDLHDENVLTNNSVLFFIDSVFYLTDEFYS